MSQATNKEVDFSSQQHFQLLPCLIPHRFHCRLNTLSLKIKTELNLTLAASVIYSMTWHFVWPFSVWLWEDEVTGESYNDKKSSKKGKD